MTTRLEIVNAALAATGVAPVSTADSSHPDVAPVDVVINRVSTQIQKRGWWFNKDYNLTLTPDSNGKILIPSTTLSIDPTDSNSPLVQRGSFLYDTTAHTFNIGESVSVNLITELAIDELPESAGQYILETVVHQFYVNDDGDLNKAREMEKRKNEAWIELKREELKNADHNSNNRPAVQQMRSGINPRGGRVYTNDPTYPGGGN